MPGSRGGYFWFAPTPWGSMCVLASAISFIPGQLLCSVVLASAWGAFLHLLSFSSSSWGAWGAFLLLLTFSSSSWGVFNPFLSFSSSSWGVFILLLFRWDYEGNGEIVPSATCSGGLCFYGHSSIRHSCGQGFFITGGNSLDTCQGTATGLFSSEPSWFQLGCLGWCGPPPLCSRWVSFYSVYCPQPVCGCGACIRSPPCSCRSYPSSR